MAVTEIAPLRPPLWPWFAAARVAQVVMDLLLLRRPIVLLARASGESSRETRRLSVNDLFDAAGVLLSRHGIDVLSALPAKAVLRERLKAAVPVVSFQDGKRFTNRFVEIDLRRTHGVYILLSTGTGRKLDEDDLQPFVTRARAVVKETNAAAVFAKRWDRVSRDEWALGPLIIAIRKIGAFAGDQDTEFLKIVGMNSFLIFFKATVAAEQAQQLPLQTRKTMTTESDRVMVDGQARCSTYHQPPPGFARVRLKAGVGVGPQVLFLDSPHCYPPADECATALPEVRMDDVDGDGNPVSVLVDQVENVRWFLRHFGKPGWSNRKLLLTLAERRYSTDALRRRHEDPSAWARVTEDMDAYLKALLSNLDVYENGEIVYPFGVDGVTDFTMTGCWPTDGLGWATPADFARIRIAMDKNRTLWDRRNIFTFTGVAASFEGSPGSLSALWAKVGSRRRTEPHYVLKRDRRVMVALPHAVLANTIAETIASADEVPLHLLTVEDEPECDDDARRALNVAVSALEHLRAKADSLRELALERNPDGTSRLSGMLLEAVNSDFDELVLHSIPAAEADIDEQRSSIAVARRQRLDERLQAGLNVDHLPALIASVDDPTDTRFMDLWQHMLRDLCFERDVIHIGRKTGETVRFSGNLVIEDGDVSWSMPFAGEYRHGAAIRLLDDCARVADAMADGVPLSAQDATDRASVVRHLSETLSPGRPLWVQQVDDPRLVRIVMHAMYRRAGRSDAQIAADLGEPVAFVEHVARVHEARRNPSWLINPQRRNALALHDAALDDGLVRFESRSELRMQYHLLQRLYRDDVSLCEEGVRVMPCACGSHLRAKLSIPESSGLFCLSCRTDELGFRWDESYNRFLDGGELWRDVLDGLGQPMGTPPVRHRHMDDVRSKLADVAGREEEIAARYAAGSTLHAIGKEYGMSHQIMKKAVLAAGGEIRPPGWNRRGLPATSPTGSDSA